MKERCLALVAGDRWHIPGPIRFDQNLKAAIQNLGWKSGERHMKLQDGTASVAWWLQTEPHLEFTPLPSRDEQESH